MNWTAIFSSKLVTDLGWTLISSFWQIATVGCALAVVLGALRKSSANLRYTASVAALGISIALPIATFVQLSTKISDPPSTRTHTDDALSGAGKTDDLARAKPEGLQTFRQGATEANDTSLITDLLSDLTGRVPNVLPFAVGLWLLGVAGFSVRLGGGLWQLKRYRMQGILPVDDHWKQTFSSLCDRLDMRGTVDLLRSTVIETPIAVGFMKPMIIVPASLFLQIPARELETIIAHELIHIRRYDPLINAFQAVAETMFFYHPGIWWISARIRSEREFAADAAVLHVLEDSHVVYASALANLEEIRLLANKDRPRLATAANGGNLMLRVQRILRIKPEAERATLARTAGAVVLATSALLLALFTFSSPWEGSAQNRASGRKVAIGFVSIPPLDRTENPPKDSDATARLIIARLKEYKIPAIGFVQGGMISDGEKLFQVRANIVRLWRDAGFEIGIGGFKHINFHNTSYDDYVANVEKNERITRDLLAEKNLKLRYFSYPYLYTSKSADDHKKFESWLASRGLTSVKYGIDNNEWMYSYAYDMARNDNDVNRMKEIRAEFLDYMTKIFSHYEQYSKEMFGRDIPQTMVLTPSRLVADTGDELFGMMQKRGYSFISMEDAMADEVYKADDHYAGNGGISWFERWTLNAGKRLFNEPEVDPDVQRAWDKKGVSTSKK